jgi:hypothetical protein
MKFRALPEQKNSQTTKRKRSFRLFNIAWLSVILVSVFAMACKKVVEEAGTTDLCPIVISTDPAAGAVNVSTGKIITATFNEAVDPATVNSTTFLLRQGTTVIPGVVTYSGVTATFTPSSPLSASTVYTATVTTGVRDPQRNAMVADHVWSFNTGVIPTVVSTVPANGATDVATNRVTATFSTTMDPATLNSPATTFTVRNGATVVPGVVTYSGTTATFTPTSLLAPNSTFTGVITTAAKDVSGNALGANYVWSFSTGATPAVVSTDPANGATNVATTKTITALFNKVMDGATIIAPGTFTLRQGTPAAPGALIPGTVTYSGSTATFQPTAPLLPSTTYTGTITTAAKDLSGNAMAANYVWSFTTGEASPIVLSTDPAPNAINVVITKTISATFNKAMNPATINVLSFTLKQAANNVIGVVNYSGTTATFNPINDLAANTVYTATITTAAKDVAGNSLAADYVWSFTTTASPVPPPVSFLGTIDAFGAFGGNAGITNQGLNTVINNGSIGTTAASTLITGFHDGITGAVYTETPLNKGLVTGRIYTAPPAPGDATSQAIATQALIDANAAYLFISPASKPGGIDPGAGQLGNLTLTPGVYKSAGASFNITTGDLTLDAQGNPNAQFFFQSAGGLTVGAAGFPRSVKLINGALARNVYWYVGSQAVINGTGGGVMVGTIIASAGVTFSTAGNAVQTVLNGRAISLVASVTMVNTTINVPN